MSIIPELFLFLRVRNNFPGNVSFSCTLRGELGIKEGERTGKSILRWEQREPGSRGTRQAARESTRAWFPGAVGVLRAVGRTAGSALARLPGFGMESGWEVRGGKPLETIADVKA